MPGPGVGGQEALPPGGNHRLCELTTASPPAWTPGAPSRGRGTLSTVSLPVGEWGSTAGAGAQETSKAPYLRPAGLAQGGRVGTCAEGRLLCQGKGTWHSQRQRSKGWQRSPARKLSEAGVREGRKAGRALVGRSKIPLCLVPDPGGSLPRLQQPGSSQGAAAPLGDPIRGLEGEQQDSQHSFTSPASQYWRDLQPCKFQA